MKHLSNPDNLNENYLNTMPILTALEKFSSKKSVHKINKENNKK